MRLFLCLVVSFAAVSGAGADERYFVTLYASQRSDRDPQRSHSFAVFVKATPDGDSTRCESFTISWMPASGVIRLLARPEPGMNFTFAESLRWAARQGLRTTAWGPFEIPKEILDRAADQKRRLESGAVLYKALDRRSRLGAINCIHAVSDVIPGPLLSTGSARGETATGLIAAHYRPYVIEPERTHHWVLRAADPQTGGADAVDSE
jgi:hypothetical protein